MSQGGKLLIPYDIAISGDGKIYLTELDSAGFIVGGIPGRGDRSGNGCAADPRASRERARNRGRAGNSGTTPACRDGLDNDGDGRVDFPRDLGCTTADDGTEEPPCADGFDNDGDGLVDDAEDPGCGGRTH